MLTKQWKIRIVIVHDSDEPSPFLGQLIESLRYAGVVHDVVDTAIEDDTFGSGYGLRRQFDLPMGHDDEARRRAERCAQRMRTYQLDATVIHCR